MTSRQGSHRSSSLVKVKLYEFWLKNLHPLGSIFNPKTLTKPLPLRFIGAYEVITPTVCPCPNITLITDPYFFQLKTSSIEKRKVQAIFAVDEN